MVCAKTGDETNGDSKKANKSLGSIFIMVTEVLMIIFIRFVYMWRHVTATSNIRIRQIILMNGLNTYANLIIFWNVNFGAT